MLVDFHSHILPGVDDGSASIEESLKMLQAEAGQGITHVVATPHFYPRYDDPERFLERRNAASEALQQLTRGIEGPLHKGALGVCITASAVVGHYTQANENSMSL